LAGCEVKIFSKEDQPGGGLWKRSDSNPTLRSAVQNEIEGIMSGGIGFEGGLQTLESLNLDHFRANYQVVYFEGTGGNETFEIFRRWFGPDWKHVVNQQTGRVTNFPEFFVGTDFSRDGISLVEAAARGRKAATAIFKYLNPLSGVNL
jgi:hypothetical protein